MSVQNNIERTLEDIEYLADSMEKDEYVTFLEGLIVELRERLQTVVALQKELTE